MVESPRKRQATAIRSLPTGNISDEIDREFERLRREMVSQFFPGMAFWGRPISEERFPARADIEDTGDAYVVRADLPGIGKENIDVKVTGHLLRVDARQLTKKEEKGENYLRRERVQEGYERTFDLPEDVISEKISARYLDGVLTLEIPKAHPEEPKKIPVV